MRKTLIERWPISSALLLALATFLFAVGMSEVTHKEMFLVWMLVGFAAIGGPFYWFEYRTYKAREKERLEQ